MRRESGESVNIAGVCEYVSVCVCAWVLRGTGGIAQGVEDLCSYIATYRQLISQRAVRGIAVDVSARRREPGWAERVKPTDTDRESERGQCVCVCVTNRVTVASSTATLVA